MKLGPRSVFAVVLVCLFLSGMAGLVYEIVWARYLALFLGHTSYAVVAVLVAFMGGLALGNTWIGNRADRTQRPLAFYAWIEIGIGVYALGFPIYYGFCHQTFISLAHHLSPGSSTLVVMKFAFSFGAILFPTVLMGGSLPLLTRLLTRSLSELRASVAALYFINSAGAVAGCVVGDFWFIPALGLDATLYGAAAMNLTAGAMALFVSSWIKEGTQTLSETSAAADATQGTTATDTQPTPSASQAEPAEETFSTLELRLAVAGIGLSGFVAMLYEVVWTRLLALVLGSSTHAFALMLITFITGIAVGAGIVYHWKSLRRTFQAFAWAELALAGTLFLSMCAYEYLPFWFARLSSFLVRSDNTYFLYGLLQATICFGVMFIPAVCLGVTLPLVSRVATVELKRAGSSVGKVFAVNTLGTVLGAAVTGIWLLPWLGLAQTFAAGVALNAVVGLVLLGRRVVKAKPLSLLLAPVVVVAWVWLAGAVFDPTWRAAFTLGLFRQDRPPADLSEYRSLIREVDLVYYKDGAGATVNVTRLHKTNRDDFYLKVNGKTDASTTDDMITQLLSGHIPMLLHPDPRQVMVIGLGSGVTCAAVLRHTNVNLLDAVEISPEVVAAAGQFAAHNDNVLANPRLHLVVEDAKTYLQMTTNSYDAIISEPSNPWMAGVAGVFSREFYETCRSRLRPDGLMVQWVQTYESSDAALEIMLATFGAVFPDFSIWQGCLGDLLIVGSQQPLAVDLARVQRRFDQPAIRDSLQRINVNELSVLLAQELISERNAPFVAPLDALVHSDFYPVLEFVAQRAFFVRRDAERCTALDENLSPRASTHLVHYLAAYPLRKADFTALKEFHFGKRTLRAPLVRSILLRWRREDPEDIEPVVLTARIADVTSQGQLEALRLAPLREVLMEHAATDPQLLRHYAVSLMATYREQRSVFFTPSVTALKAALERLLATDSKNQRTYRLFLAEIAWDHQDEEECLRQGKAAFDPELGQGGPLNFDLDPRAPRQTLARLIELNWRANRLEDAWNLCLELLRKGYVTPQGDSSDALLAMTYRKVLAAMDKTKNQKPGLVASPLTAADQDQPRP